MKTNEVLGHAAAQWPSQLTEPSPIDHAYHPPKWRGLQEKPGEACQETNQLIQGRNVQLNNMFHFLSTSQLHIQFLLLTYQKTSACSPHTRTPMRAYHPDLIKCAPELEVQLQRNPLSWKAAGSSHMVFLFFFNFVQPSSSALTFSPSYHPLTGHPTLSICQAASAVKTMHQSSHKEHGSRLLSPCSPAGLAAAPCSGLSRLQPRSSNHCATASSKEL